MALALLLTRTVAAASLCPAPDKALREMVSTEFAFAAKAKESVRAAFLEYLAPDSVVLQPYPRPAVPLYMAAKDSRDTLEWYPTIAQIAPSGNLGFSAGPWTSRAADGSAPQFGHFLTIWRRDALCAWHVELDAGVTHPAPTVVEPPLTAAAAIFMDLQTPPGALITANALNHAIEDFQQVAHKSSAAAALRTYGRNGAMSLYVDDLSPLDGGAAVSDYLAAHPVQGVWKEIGHGRSGDATMAYTTGEVYDSQTKPTHAYVQVWLYDPKVANWGLRVLLLSRLPAR